jgi:membrane peptidoglycan carboxypeptidase
MKVTTTLDADLETKAESILNTYALQNEKTFKA